MRHFCNVTWKTVLSSWRLWSEDQIRRQGNRGICLFLVLLMGLIQFATPALLNAKEPYLEFVQGLRERQYFDSAMLYLDSLKSRENVPDEIKQIIPFEKAVTLLRSSQFSQNPDAQAELLDQAQAYLEQFIKKSPKHELVASANT